ncbi:glycine--tRNA ligase subunit beta, partial [Pseudomonas sp. MWU12-2115]|uniref:glycine--tRNA ligase subunit beta n=1 Tax=Pseudomonas sp. MWU12-2115 TaxID=2071713 RepID=UPI001C49C23F
PISSHIIQGNERVLRARLSDAKFFFEQDQKARLETRLAKLAEVVYHNKIGSQLERVERLQSIAGQIAALLGADQAVAERAALLAKADLGIARRFSELVADRELAARLFGLIEAEWQKTHDAFFAITGQSQLLESNPTLRRSLETRLPYLDALGLLQIDLLARLRAEPDDEDTLYAIHLTINGTSAGLRNTG